MNTEPSIKSRIERVRRLAVDDSDTTNYYEAAALAQSVVYDTAGKAHPLAQVLAEATKSGDWTRVLGACRAAIAAYDDGALPGPRLRIAHEIEGDLLDIAQAQSQLAEGATVGSARQVSLAIAAFLAGASLEDALRRLCDAAGIAYDQQRTSIAKLQGALYQPSNQVELISLSENKQITVWGDTRNKADHGKFAEITQTEVTAMVIGVRAFVDKHLP